MILRNELLEVSAKSSGAELTSIKLNGYEYLWNGDKKYWGRQAPILFPIVGRFKNDKTYIEGNEYSMGRHGFARNMEFSEVSSCENKVTYLLKSNDETLKVYPYRFELYISYELIENRVKVTYEVNNIDDKTIFFSIGGHPAFRCPISEGESFNDCYVEFEKNETQYFISQTDGCIAFTDEKVLDNENRIDLSKEKLKAIDTYIFRDLNSEVVSVKSNKSSRSVSLHAKGFPFYGIWTHDSEAEFVCLEPWYGITDTVDCTGRFEEKLGVLSLEKGKRFSCSYEIEVN